MGPDLFSHIKQLKTIQDNCETSVFRQWPKGNTEHQFVGEGKKYMIPTAALADGLEFPRGSVMKRNLNNAQRPCEVEKTESEETKSPRI